MSTVSIYKESFSPWDTLDFGDIALVNHPTATLLASLVVRPPEIGTPFVVVKVCISWWEHKKVN
jgi:hypothetical protein